MTVFLNCPVGRHLHFQTAGHRLQPVPGNTLNAAFQQRLVICFGRRSHLPVFYNGWIYQWCNQVIVSAVHRYYLCGFKTHFIHIAHLFSKPFYCFYLVFVGFKRPGTGKRTAFYQFSCFPFYKCSGTFYQFIQVTNHTVIVCTSCVVPIEMISLVEPASTVRFVFSIGEIMGIGAGGSVIFWMRILPFQGNQFKVLLKIKK